MAVTNFNIKQITNYDILNYPTSIYKITFPNGDSADVTYITALENERIIKFGYCCEPQGIRFPIYIETNDGNGYREIQIGKTGMYEVQPEIWQDVNDPDSEGEETSVIITGIKVPKDVGFTLEYVISIN